MYGRRPLLDAASAARLNGEAAIGGKGSVSVPSKQGRSVPTGSVRLVSLPACAACERLALRNAVVLRVLAARGARHWIGMLDREQPIEARIVVGKVALKVAAGVALHLVRLRRGAAQRVGLNHGRSGGKGRKQCPSCRDRRAH